jgi:hypothetical protein
MTELTELSVILPDWRHAMNLSLMFLAGLGFTLAISLTAVIYLKSSLRRLLCKVCGNDERAAFWTAFTNTVLLLVPLVFALQSQPSEGSQARVLFELADQLKWGLIGLASSILTVGWVLGRFILRTRLAYLNAASSKP